MNNPWPTNPSEIRLAKALDDHIAYADEQDDNRPHRLLVIALGLGWLLCMTVLAAVCILNLFGGGK